MEKCTVQNCVSMTFFLKRLKELTKLNWFSITRIFFLIHSFPYSIPSWSCCFVACHPSFTVSICTGRTWQEKLSTTRNQSAMRTPTTTILSSDQQFTKPPFFPTRNVVVLSCIVCVCVCLMCIHYLLAVHLQNNFMCTLANEQMPYTAIGPATHIILCMAWSKLSATLPWGLS